LLWISLKNKNFSPPFAVMRPTIVIANITPPTMFVKIALDDIEHPAFVRTPISIIIPTIQEPTNNQFTDELINIGMLKYAVVNDNINILNVLFPCLL